MLRFAVIVGCLSFAAAASGCGPVLYMVNLSGAQHAVEEARQAGGPQRAPYEYHFALEHLRKAQEFAGTAEYQDAVDMASVAEDYGNRAREIARGRANASPR
ncbi:MAG: DUF4398 domain-containing protein [Deltaproteobacteria bacterium]|nr:DUF4398 domain-containing protein [Deltaproteobacteria bacterium]MBK7064839.1 DUF4398 domain-containing protein [Deltaproteobacteria bacterium]